MKDTIIKKITIWIGFFAIFNYVSYVNDLDNKKDELFQKIDEVVFDGTTSATRKQNYVASDDKVVATKSTPIKEIKLKKNKNGEFIVPWDLLTEYDLSKKTPSSNLTKVIGQKVSIKGFMIPLDYSAKQLKEFLLIPYMPSCAHVPPPTANMIINVSFTGKKKLKPSYYPITIHGTLNVSAPTGKSNPYLPEGIYTMLATSISEIN